MYRPLPELNAQNRAFWTSGAYGALHIQRCGDCRTWIHPGGLICPGCLSENLSDEAVSGQATVLSVTLNHQDWGTGRPTPYAIAIVGLAEQKGLNLTTNIVEVEPSEVTIGMPVQIQFEQHGEIFVPLFAPTR